MADETAPIGQKEIDQLLKQAQGASDEASPSSPGASVAPNDSNAAVPSLAASSGGGVASPSTAKSSGIAQGDIDYLLNQAEQALASINTPPASNESLAGVKPFKLPDFAAGANTGNAATLDLIRDVELDLRIELGRTHMHLEDVLKLAKGSVVTLDKLAGDPVDIFVNGRLIARAEVLILNENFCVRVAELMAPEAAPHVA
ncbi:MAG TPA: flagellar motor switch protein FliN [Pirellulales bacterium]|jgi:flagellar motor switch protein FliN/FliY|nr:flagellar motor switch protein FliN [Pirellulales bacterium]